MPKREEKSRPKTKETTQESPQHSLLASSNLDLLTKSHLSERAVSLRYSVGCRQLRAMRLRGDGPRFIKVSGTLGQLGGRILYPVVELEQWLASLPVGGGRAA